MKWSLPLIETQFAQKGTCKQEIKQPQQRDTKKRHKKPTRKCKKQRIIITNNMKTK